MANMFRQGNLNDILKANATASSDAWQSGVDDERKSQLAARAQRADAESKLAQLIKGSELKQAESNADIENAKKLREQYGNEIAVHVGDASLGDTDPLARLLKRRQLDKPMLTPGQEQAEKDSAKKVADYEAGGGRSMAEQNMRQIKEVQDELGAGKRDNYDRVVGGMLSNFPSAMGVFAPAEKQRRDKIRNTANSLAKQSDPNPTQQQIETLMGQLYDTSSDNAGNISRLKDFATKQQNVNSQLEQAAQNLRSTGYVTPGLAGNPNAPAWGKAAAPTPQTSQKQPLKVERNKRTGQTRITYDDGTVEVQ